MPVVSFEKVSIAFGLHPLLDHADFQLFSNEKVCLVGRNGAGKSTLLKLIQKSVLPDDGEVRIRNEVKVGMLPQDLPAADQTTIFDFVAQGLGEHGRLLKEYHQLSSSQGDLSEAQWMDALQKVQAKVDAVNAWELQQKVDQTLSRLNLPAEATMDSLSGGWRRRVALAQVLVQEPNVFLLDEPTNHMDLETILWMEDVLKNYQGTVLFISHDRLFIDQIATRIIELDRGLISSWPGNFTAFRDGKERALEVEAQQNALFDKRLAEEEVWIRQGIKARRTRNEGRVRALKKLRDEHRARVDYQKTPQFNLEEASRSGKLVAELNNISYRYDTDFDIVSNFSARIMRGDRIGILGPNGCGKSTLIQLILGRLQPTSGECDLGTQLEVAYFDQTRSQLDMEKSIADNVGDGRDTLDIGGNSRHILSYLNDFLFSAERARTPVKALSGGEINRVLLAKIFAKPSNLLILDEPTNDLDIETVELLEYLIGEYSGTIFLVSHDRAFINNAVTSTMVFEGNGQIQEYVGGYDDWKRQSTQDGYNDSSSGNTAKKSDKDKADKKGQKGQKLSYKEQRRLELLPAELESLEAELDTLTQQTADADFYKQEHDTVQKVLKLVEDAEGRLEKSFEEWESLEQKQQNLKST
jgi:ABC transport system ATP-binding/permease protein